jgi:hypothetical protein
LRAAARISATDIFFFSAMQCYRRLDPLNLCENRQCRLAIRGGLVTIFTNCPNSLFPAVRMSTTPLQNAGVLKGSLNQIESNSPSQAE